MSAFEKQLALVEADLRPGERVLASLKGVDGSLTGALVVTDQRFVFSGSNGLKKERRTHPWQQVTAIEHEINRLGVDYLRVSLPSGNQKYLISRGAEAASFVSAALAALSDARNPSTSVPDVADQLVKLGQLRDAGILSEEEFATKKAELLARM